MFELKKGMKVRVINGKTYTFYSYYKTYDGKEAFIEKEIGNIVILLENIDWEETTKLNGIDLEKETSYKMDGIIPINESTYVPMGDYSKKEFEVLPNLEKFEEEIGYKETKGKIRPNLLPITELKDVIRVFEYGVEKYSKDNWKHVKDPINEYSNALSRHLLDYLEGEKKASDSNLPHLAHICANALILMWFENNKEE